MKNSTKNTARRNGRREMPGTAAPEGCCQVEEDTIMHELTVKFYNEHASEMADLYERADMSSFYKGILPLVKPGMAILEIGCGSGRDARLFAGLGATVTATDASLGMLEEARRRDDAATVNFLQKAFPLPDGDTLFGKKYDLIVAMAVISHIPCAERPAFMQQIKHLLATGGFFVCSWANKLGETERLYEHLTQTEMAALVENANLEVVRHCASFDVLGRDVRWLNILVRNPGTVFYERS